uniref:Uncharacterized protein MANES_08G117800 n=1 Tax=Rhizophora mucronata TaxID=61149 RepID=A0A2P2INB1_RHIMU
MYGRHLDKLQVLQPLFLLLIHLLLLLRIVASFGHYFLFFILVEN